MIKDSYKNPRRSAVSCVAAAAAVLLMAVSLESCRHKELCYDHNHQVSVSVVFDWSAAPGADVSSMSLYLFPVRGGDPVRYDFSDVNGGVVSVSHGTYNAVCLNNDTQTLLLRGFSSIDSAEVYTRDASVLEGLGLMSSTSAGGPLPEGADHLSTVLAPDMLYTDVADNVLLSIDDSTSTLTMYPAAATSRVTVEVLNVENIEYISNISGALSGAAGSWFLGRRDYSLTSVNVPHDGVSTISAEFSAFVHRPGTGTGDPNLLTLYMILTDGSQIYTSFDVTDQVASAPDHHDIHIVIDGYKVEEPGDVGEGGFSPTIDDWIDEEIIDLPMGKKK